MYIPSKLMLHDITAEGDKYTMTHIQNVAPIQEHCHFLRMNSNRGFTQGRTMQHIGSIPDAIYFSHPEFAGEDGPENMVKWLKSEEGRPYRITDGI